MPTKVKDIIKDVEFYMEDFRDEYYKRLNDLWYSQEEMDKIRMDAVIEAVEGITKRFKESLEQLQKEILGDCIDKVPVDQINSVFSRYGLDTSVSALKTMGGSNSHGQSECESSELGGSTPPKPNPIQEWEKAIKRIKL